ncbi:MAG: DNA polymerase III subunit gamma/tau [Eubacterium sp.]|nr:DNA polymerase III subunit gamma/tau [Eubacterium sp.]
MSYTALYRKFRPTTFEDVKGQEHIVQTLQNQIKANRIGHAYLFCGTRGTGKTSVAKIFARAVNCENPVNGSPCNHCPTCQAINNGSAMNVMEIDAASNNGVDNIRQIREEIQYSPSSGKFTVYIIDEVHMLSIGAFNALLKTLEEPPSYAMFILATTEPHKIPITILSRCQRYDFKRITIDTIAARLSELMEKEQIEVEEKAIRYVAKAADGSMRDALSLLDQCIAFYLGQKLTYDNVLEVLGAVDQEVFSRLTRAVIGGDTVQSISILDEMVMQGRELGQFVNDFIWYLRNLMLVKTSDGSVEDIIDASAERLEALKSEASMVDTDIIMRYIRVLSELSGQMKYSSQKRVLIEIALIKLNQPAMERDMGSLNNRIALLEKKIEQGDFVVPQNAVAGPSVATPQPAKPKKVWDKAVPEDIQYVVNNWGAVQRHISQPYKQFLNGARFSVKGEDTLLIVFEGYAATGYGACNKPEVIEMLNTIISDEIKKQVKVELKLLETNQNFNDYYQEVISHINMEVEEEDF